ncbi:MAG: hypothetical protein ACYC5O_02535 [Anaerolineae bacterium]
MPSADREQLKRLIDLLPEEELHTVERLLLGLIALDRDPAVAARVSPSAGPPPPPADALLLPQDPLAQRGPDTERARRLLLDLLEDD